MSDVEVLGQLGAVLGAAPSDTTVRRTLELAVLPALQRRLSSLTGDCCSN